MLNFGLSQTHGLVRVRVMGLEQLIDFISSGHNPILVEVFALGHGVGSNKYA